MQARGSGAPPGGDAGGARGGSSACRLSGTAAGAAGRGRCLPGVILPALSRVYASSPAVVEMLRGLRLPVTKLVWVLSA